MSEKSSVKSYVSGKISRLKNSLGTSGGKAELANLRRGVGRKPGELPALWGAFLQDLPEELTSRSGNPSKAEWAVYTAITMYALHQQGQAEPMDKEGIRMGSALRGLIRSEEDEERIRRRFNIMASARDMEALSYNLRNIVQLLRSEGIPLDYALLAGDLYDYQYEDSEDSVRLRWGQDFYRIRKEEE